MSNLGFPVLFRHTKSKFEVSLFSYYFAQTKTQSLPSLACIFQDFLHIFSTTFGSLEGESPQGF